MSLRNNPTPPSGLVYDWDQGVCYSNSEIPTESKKLAANADRYEPVSPLRQALDVFGDESTRPMRLWDNNLILKSFAVVPVGAAAVSLSPVFATACSFDSSGTGEVAKSISSITSLSSEKVMNEFPITGTLSGVGIAGNETTEGFDVLTAVAWSTENFLDPARHGTFLNLRDGADDFAQDQVDSDPNFLNQGTSVAVMKNGETVVSYFRFQGDDVESTVVARRLARAGDQVGADIEILGPKIRTEAPELKLIATEEGFIAVYKEQNSDGTHKLVASEFNGDGVLQESKTISNLGGPFQIARGMDGEWVLAQIVGASKIRVRTFLGMNEGQVDTEISTDTLPAEPRVSVAMQENGSIMAVWNGTESSGGASDPILQGAFLEPSGKIKRGPFLVRRLGEAVQSGEVHFNSHSVAADQEGNFIVVFEENRNMVAYVYEGTERRADLTKSDISSKTFNPSGEYQDIFQGLQNTSAQNVDVQVMIHPEDPSQPDGAKVLSFVYTKILSGDDPSTGTTTTAQQIIRRDYRIDYK